MANEQDKNPSTGSESDISKAQFQQQPPNQSSQQQGESGQRQGQFGSGEQDNAERSGDQASTGQFQSGSSPDEGLQGDTLAQQRSDIEGSSLGSQGSGGAGGNFVGSQGQQDSSSRLIDEEDEDFSKDGQGAPEGK